VKDTTEYTEIRNIKERTDGLCCRVDVYRQNVIVHMKQILMMEIKD